MGLVQLVNLVRVSKHVCKRQTQLNEIRLSLLCMCISCLRSTQVCYPAGICVSQPCGLAKCSYSQQVLSPSRCPLMPGGHYSTSSSRTYSRLTITLWMGARVLTGCPQPMWMCDPSCWMMSSYVLSTLGIFIPWRLCYLFLLYPFTSILLILTFSTIFFMSWSFSTGCYNLQNSLSPDSCFFK